MAMSTFDPLHQASRATTSVMPRDHLTERLELFERALESEPGALIFAALRMDERLVEELEHLAWMKFIVYERTLSGARVTLTSQGRAFARRLLAERDSGRNVPAMVD